MKDNKDKLENEYKDNKKRKIEFRGKRVDNGEWVYGLPMYMNYIKEFTEHEWIDELDNNRVKKYQTSADFQIEGETLGQFTGLCDKNGKKIYEGDVVNILYDDDVIENCVVVFGDYSIFRDEWGYRYSNCGFALKFDDDSGYTNLTSQKTYKYEVVGNIYDNGGSDEECDN